jgi:hypothetical protein
MRAFPTGLVSQSSTNAVFGVTLLCRHCGCANRLTKRETSGMVLGVRTEHSVWTVRMNRAFSAPLVGGSLSRLVAAHGVQIVALQRRDCLRTIASGCWRGGCTNRRTKVRGVPFKQLALCRPHSGCKKNHERKNSSPRRQCTLSQLSYWVVTGTRQNGRACGTVRERS